jgi:teichuronic acid biosynthesis glycosyltransferase TuaC
MKVLFVSSGNSKNGVSPIVKSQGESLHKAGIHVEYFTIVGRGISGYLKNIIPLKDKIKKGRCDLVHAHYSLSALVATLAGCRPLVVSLMGSDMRLAPVFRWAVQLSSRLFWDALIVKSQDMLENCCLKKAMIIPNGVDISLFKPIEREKAIEALGWDKRKKHLLFSADPSRPVKNYPLFQKAIDVLETREDAQAHTLGGIRHTDVPFFINASDVVVLTSLWEGSPNMIKEALACNRPAVATNVGDINWLFGEQSGYLLTDFNPVDVANKIKLALEFSEKYLQTSGRQRIIELGLDSGSISKRMISIYQQVLK